MLRRSLLGLAIVGCSLTSLANAADLLPFGSNWSYLNPQVIADDPGATNASFDTNWFEAGFDASAWKGPSPAPFVRGGVEAFTETDRDFIRAAGTELDLPVSRERNSMYFRTQFTTAEPTSNLALQYLIDDGARIYLNGDEILSVRCCNDLDGMPVEIGTPTSFEHVATGNASERVYDLVSILTGDTLPAGTHTLAVQTHNFSSRSNDGAMSLRLFDGYIYNPVISPFQEWAYFEGEEEPATDELEWTTTSFDDSTWDRGDDGFGYDVNETTVEAFENNVGTELGSMVDAYTSVYLRKEFEVDDASLYSQAELTIDYDDSFVAYINGVEVTRAEVDEDMLPVGTAVPFDQLDGIGSHDSTDGSGEPGEVFSFTINPDLLNPGADNVLAIHGLNTAIDSSDFFLGQFQLALIGGDTGVTTGTPGDFDGNGVLEANDIDLLTAAIRAGDSDAQFDLNGDGAVDLGDQGFWITDIKNTWIGDANLDGQFSTFDFVGVIGAGEFEDTIVGNSTWAEGDWNGDGDFTTSDFVAALVGGGFEQGLRPGGPNAAVAAVPEPASGVLLSMASLMLLGLRRRS